MRSIFQKEWKHLFLSMTGYVFLGVFLLASALMFVSIHLLGLSGDVKDFFSVVFWIVLAVIPLLTMRAFSEEHKTRTDALLLTLPFSKYAVVMGKYWAVMAALTMGFIFTTGYFLIFSLYGSADKLALLGNYIGLILLSSAFTAIGLWVSSRSENQFVAAIITIFLLLLFVMLDWVTPFIQSPVIKRIVSTLSLQSHYRPFTYGIFSPASIVYYLGITAFFLVLCRYRFERLFQWSDRLLCGLLAALLVVGVAFSETAVNRWGLTIDMTEERLYELSDITVQAVTTGKGTVSVTVYAAEDDYPVVVATTLKRICGLDSRITLRYVDLYQTPSESKYLAQKGISIKENDLLLSGDYRDRVITLEDMCDYNNANQIEALRIEERFVNALRYVEMTRVPRALLTDGHGETPTAALITLLEQTGYEIGYTTLNAAPVCDLLVMAAPAKDLSQTELLSLETYLQSGGQLLAFVQPTTEEMQGLYQLYKRYGIKVDSGIVAEETAYLSDNPLNLVPAYMSHSINAVFENNRYFCVMPSSTALSIDTATLSDTIVQPLLITSQNAYRKAGLHYSSLLREDEDLSGPFYLGITAKQGEAKLAVYASVEMIGSAVLDNDAYADRTLLIRTLNWLDDEVEAVSISPKLARPGNIAVSIADAQRWSILLVVLLPLAALITGAVITWVRRRQ